MEAELPLGWTSHVAPTGHIYYYNASTKKSTYKRPSEESAILKELPNEAQIAAIEGQLDNKGAEQTVAAVTRTDKTLRRDKTDRPKDKIHIPGIEPWIQVHTKAGRRFYHNQDTSESYWTVPDAIVDLVNAWEQGDDELGSQAQSEAGFHPEYEYEEQPAEEPDQQQPASPTALRTEFDEDDIAWQLAALEEAGEGLIQTPDEDMVELSLQEKMSIFKIMLSDRQVDPFRTWDLELPKIASDPRYLVLDSTRQRKAVFEEYCTDQAKEKQERQASTLKVDVSRLRCEERRMKTNVISPPLLSFDCLVDRSRKHRTSKTSSVSTKKTTSTRRMVTLITNERSSLGRSPITRN